MNAQKCLEILRKIKDVSFATVDEKGLPQVRIINDHHVAISAMNEKYQMVRLSGIAEKLEDLPTAVHQRIRDQPDTLPSLRIM